MKQYVITDPCYILSKEEWSNIIPKPLNDDYDWDDYNTQLAEQLTKKTGCEAYVSSTGFGDWENQLYGPNIISETDSFTADAGEVCVCEYTDEVKQALNGIPESCYCVFEAEEDITVDFDTDDRSWTIVNISDSKDNTWNTWMPDTEDED